MHPLEDIETPPCLEEDMEDVPDIALEMNNLPMIPTTQWAIENNEWRKAVQAYLACVLFVSLYIHYNNGAEEFYDHREDPNKWYNLVRQEEEIDEIQRFRKFLQETNVPGCIPNFFQTISFMSFLRNFSYV